MDPTNCISFCNIIRAVEDGIAKVHYNSRFAAADEHWENWDAFCRNVAFDPLLVSYRDLLPILNAF